MKTLLDGLADAVAHVSAGRMRRRHPDWADAMLNEHASLAGRWDRFGWAFGSLYAGFTWEDAVYPAVLSLAVVAMGLYQWSADESVITLAVLSVLALALGLLRPAQFLDSGVALGAVVTVVNGFETFSSIRPAYETHVHTLGQDLKWLFLLLPALVCSTIGRQLGRKFVA